MDLLPTLAAIVGGKVPDDRIIDGVDQSEFFSGRQEKSNRESFVVYVGNDIFGVKWRNWKMMMRELRQAFGEPTKEYPVPLIFDLHTDPREEHPLDPRWWQTGWVRWPAGQVLVDHVVSLKKEPPIPMGMPDPYEPVRNQ